MRDIPISQNLCYNLNAGGRSGISLKKFGFHFGRNNKGFAKAKLRLSDIRITTSTHGETVVLLSKGEIDSKKVRVEFSLEDMDMSGFQKGATYGQIKERVLQQTGLKVSSLYIAQIKQKHGIIERENYNKSKSGNARQPKCPPEKEAAITEALKYFGML